MSTPREVSPLAEIIEVRPASSADEPFLFDLFSHSPEFELLPLIHRERLIQMQYQSQQVVYRAQFPNSGYDIVWCGPKPIGRIWIARREEDLFLVDIALHPDSQNQGIGSFLIRRLQEEARQAGKPVRCSVGRFNSGSRRFHQRLGFRIVGENDMMLSLEWVPD